MHQAGDWEHPEPATGLTLWGAPSVPPTVNFTARRGFSELAHHLVGGVAPSLHRDDPPFHTPWWANGLSSRLGLSPYDWTCLVRMAASCSSKGLEQGVPPSVRRTRPDRGRSSPDFGQHQPTVCGVGDESRRLYSPWVVSSWQCLRKNRTHFQ